MKKYTLSGTVIHGDGYGKKIGFPTANIDRRQWSHLPMKPKFGVYAGLVILNNKDVYSAGIVIGPKDTKGLPKLEAHLIGYKGNLYGKKIAFELHQYLHPFKNYPSEKELISAIGQDIVKVKKIIK